MPVNPGLSSAILDLTLDFSRIKKFTAHGNTVAVIRGVLSLSRACPEFLLDLAKDSEKARLRIGQAFLEEADFVFVEEYCNSYSNKGIGTPMADLANKAPSEFQKDGRGWSHSHDRCWGITTLEELTQLWINGIEHRDRNI